MNARAVIQSPDAYLAEAIADELTLAPMLGWAHVTPPSTITPNCWIFGTHDRARGHSHRNASAPCPKWRRDWFGAGELISRCELNIAAGATVASVSAGDLPSREAHYADYPSKDDAIRDAMCKAAIAFLMAERAMHDRAMRV